VRRSARMWLGDHVRQRDQLPGNVLVSWIGFAHENVETGTGEPFARQGCKQIAVSIKPPRAVLITNAVGFICAMRSSRMRKRVSGVSGAWSVR